MVKISENFIIDIGTILIAVVALGLSLYNTWKQHIRGPEFNIAEARVTQRLEDKTVLVVLIQNIGDRMGYVRWNEIIVKIGDKLIKTEAEAYREYKRLFKPDTQIEKGFTFPIGDHIDLIGASFLAKGVYSSHEGKGMINKTWEIHL